MAKTQQTRRPATKGGVEEPLSQARRSPSAGAELDELDQFIEKVLEEAGEEFLDEFRQIEGE